MLCMLYYLLLLLTAEAVPQLAGVPLHEPGDDLGRRQLGLLADGQHHLPAGEGRVLPARLQQLESNIMQVGSNTLRLLTCSEDTSMTNSSSGSATTLPS